MRSWRSGLGASHRRLNVPKRERQNSLSTQTQRGNHEVQQEEVICKLGKVLLIVVAQLPSHVQLFVTPWTAAHQALLSSTISWSLLKCMSTESVMPSNHLILCCPLLLLPSLLPSIKVFSKESALLHIKRPKRVLTKNQIHQHLDLGLLRLQNWEEINVSYKWPNLWYLALASQAKTRNNGYYVF